MGLEHLPDPSELKSEMPESTAEFHSYAEIEKGAGIMSKKDGRYGDFIEIADQDPKYLTELVPACIDELLTQLIAEARKDKNTPDMTTLVVTVIDWDHLDKELDKCNEIEFKHMVEQQKKIRDRNRRYTVGIRFESLNK